MHSEQYLNIRNRYSAMETIMDFHFLPSPALPGAGYMSMISARNLGHPCLKLYCKDNKFQ